MTILGVKIALGNVAERLGLPSVRLGCDCEAEKGAFCSTCGQEVITTVCLADLRRFAVQQAWDLVEGDVYVILGHVLHDGDDFLEVKLLQDDLEAFFVETPRFWLNPAVL